MFLTHPAEAGQHQSTSSTRAGAGGALVLEVLQVTVTVTVSFSSGPYDFGGILTNTNRDVVNGETVQKRTQAQKEMHW